MKFVYKIKNKVGEMIEGVAEATDKYALALQMKREGKTVISIKEAEEKRRLTMEFLNEFLARIKLQDKISFVKNLSAMVGAGLPLSRALGILERQTGNIKFKKVIRALSGEITKGNSLSQAMANFPHVFSSLFVAMVHAGEESGSLTQSLTIIGRQLEKNYALRKKVKGAMIYPAIVISAMVIIAALMLVYVVPTLAETFADLGAELPASTRFLIFASGALVENFLLFIALFVFLAGFVAYVRETEKARRFLDFLVLHTPVISKIVKEYNTAQTARTLSSLLSSDVDMVESLSITHNVLQNSYYKDVLEIAGARVQKGSPLSETFKGSEDIYPILMGEMVEVGEETGKLSDMLMNIAEFYESEVDAATKDLSTIIEPILMVVIGAGVGFFAISMISPMYEVMNNI
ncbi:MAG: type II secretion system F family protein [Patescibacteria group bacterium]|nr:MAG: type II secretion system F family protein [Patescibacteria group bacterium]